MEQVELGWDEFWAEVYRVKLRDSIECIDDYDRMVAEFCVEVLNLRPRDRVLDVACGSGSHSIQLAKLGMHVTGFDISGTLIGIAERSSQEVGANVEFYRGDMREIKFNKQFQAAVILSHSFGFFNHDENRHVLRLVYESLAPKGSLFLDLMNPYNLPRVQRTWTRVEGGYLLSEPHVVDAQAGMLRGRPATFIDEEKGRIVLMNEDAMANNDIRLYTAHEIDGLLREVGFTKTQMYGQNKHPKMPYQSNSERMVVVATR